MNQANENVKSKAGQENEVIRYLAFILRHRPHEARIKLDEGGWASIESLVSALSRFKKITTTAEAIIELVNAKCKNSFSIDSAGKMIRAKSGHTVLFGFKDAAGVPNSLCLYINKSDMPSVFAHGLTLKPGTNLVERLEGMPPKGMVLATINTSKAKNEKVKFYQKDETYFAFHIPAACIRLSSF